MKSPALVAASPGSKSNVCTESTPSKPELKWRRVLGAFYAGCSLNRFEAERAPINDHCLHSTVSELEGRGVRIERKPEVVRGYMGEPTYMKRYWLAPEARERAAELLGIPTSDKTADTLLEAV